MEEKAKPPTEKGPLKPEMFRGIEQVDGKERRIHDQKRRQMDGETNPRTRDYLGFSDFYFVVDGNFLSETDRGSLIGPLVHVRSTHDQAMDSLVDQDESDRRRASRPHSAGCRLILGREFVEFFSARRGSEQCLQFFLPFRERFLRGHD
jgi:hypothetical protein